MRGKPSAGWAFLKDPDVNRWYRNVARGSQKTADVALRNLGQFCTTMKTSPKELVSLSPKEAHDLLLDFVEVEEQRKQAGSSIATRLKHVKSWMLHNGVRIDRPIKVARSTETPTLVDERTPSQDELRKVFLAATLQGRVASVLMAHTGLRPEVLGNYLGNDGLRIKDLPDLVIEGGTVKWKQVPAMVVVRPELSKAGHRYFSFLGEEGCAYLKDYLEDRIRAGAELSPDSDLLHPRFESKSFIRTINVSDAVRKSLRTAGFSWRPYVLRAYFDTQLLVAESKGKVAHDYRVFWMGHKGSMEARYTTNKGRLPKELIEDMRGAYHRCEQYLTTVPRQDEAETQRSVLRVMLTSLGYKEEELADADLDNPKVFQDLLSKKMTSATAAVSKPRQKVVNDSEIDPYLSEGWTVHTSLSGGRVVLNSPYT